jgi:hypothetical protein
MTLTVILTLLAVMTMPAATGEVEAGLEASVSVSSIALERSAGSDVVRYEARYDGPLGTIDYVVVDGEYGCRVAFEELGERRAAVCVT